MHWKRDILCSKLGALEVALAACAATQGKDRRGEVALSHPA